ncbi:hypothetical protein Dimus_029846 [Dionaea muscipula]
MKAVQEALNSVRVSLDTFKKMESLAKEAHNGQILMKELMAQCSTDESRLNELNSTITLLQNTVKETQRTLAVNKRSLAQRKASVQQILSQLQPSEEGTLESFNLVKADVTAQWTNCKGLYDELFYQQSTSHPRDET